jgi:LysM repeat protein
MLIKKIFFILLLCPLFSYSQKKHTVGSKETLFSIGRQYNVHPRELAEFNNIPFETGLTIGQVLNIPKEKKMAPLPPTVPTVPANDVQNQTVISPQKKDANDNKVSKPIYHKVQKKETLYQISNLYNKVSIDDLKKWNNLSTDGLKEGMDLIVGHTDESKQNSAVTAEPEKIDLTIQQTISIKDEEKPEAVKKADDKKDLTKNNISENIPANNETKNSYFKAAYDNQSPKSIQQSGKAGVFKSTSGWNDGKYYCLHNSAPAGSILKITNKNNQKFVYAKVLDVIPDLKQNNDAIIIITNAAANALGADENKFDVEVDSDK